MSAERAALTFGCVLIISLIALIGLMTMHWDDDKVQRYLPIGIALAAGVLLGEAGFHLIPEAHEKGLSYAIVLGLVAIGMLFSLGIEVFCRTLLKDGAVAPVARIALLAESIHNAIDGALVAAAFIAGVRVGLMAALAVAVHELPHELGNFAVLVDSGYSRKRAVLLNLFSAFCAFLGAGSVLVLGDLLVRHSIYILPLAGGCFVYMAAIDLLPGMWRKAQGGGKTSIGLGVTAGAGIMLALTLAH